MVVVVLAAGVTIAGVWLARRLSIEPITATVSVVATTAASSLVAGLFSGRATETAAAVLLWGIVIIVTTFAVTMLRRGAAILAGILGGLLAVHAAVITFVLAAFSADEAPRQYALLWLPAMLTGTVKDLGESVNPVEEPLWFRMSEAAGPLPWLFIAVTGLVIGYLVRGRQEATR